jgi:hypothetical protein
MLSGREAAPLRVLCAWNARRMTPAQLADSWYVDDLSDEELGEAAALLQHLRFGQPVPDPLRGRTGPPLRHPADPRHEYLEEEEGLLAWLPAAFGARANPAYEGGRRPSTPWILSESDPARGRLAAEDREPFGPDAQPGDTGAGDPQ